MRCQFGGCQTPTYFQLGGILNGRLDIVKGLASFSNRTVTRRFLSVLNVFLNHRSYENQVGHNLKNLSNSARVSLFSIFTALDRAVSVFGHLDSSGRQVLINGTTIRHLSDDIGVLSSRFGTTKTNRPRNHLPRIIFYRDVTNRRGTVCVRDIDPKRNGLTIGRSMVGSHGLGRHCRLHA